MTIIFLSSSGEEEVDFKSLKYIHITLKFSFLHTAQVTYECIFIVKIQTYYLYRQKKINSTRGKNHYFYQ